MCIACCHLWKRACMIRNHIPLKGPPLPRKITSFLSFPKYFDDRHQIICISQFDSESYGSNSI